ncbi:MAG: class I SAM-dependent methyltransferase [Gemmatimonadales bacterium]|nr:class I SAM-dependent methyltransferase [Gemmatimonadales bacterium]
MPTPIDYSQFADRYDALVRFEGDIAFFMTEAGRATGEVVDLMCGTGRVAVPLLAAAIPVTCVDRSPDMLGVLRAKLARRGLEARVVEADVCALPLAPRFSLAIISFNSFAELVTTADQQAALASISRCVRPEGRFICTLHNPTVRLKDMDDTWRVRARVPDPEGRGELTLRVRETYDLKTRIVSGTQAFVTIGHDGAESQREVDFRFSALDRASFEGMAQAAGFRVEELYGDYSRAVFMSDESPFMIWVMSKE